jgi:hypothetical protein
MAQARVEGFHLLTADENLRPYGKPVLMAADLRLK